MGDINNLLIQYGYIVLFIAPMLETLAIPIPGELLMIYCGALIYAGKLNLFVSIFIGCLGVIWGLTIAYVIGNFIGIKFFIKYGRYIGLDIHKVEKVSAWFDTYGSKLLLISCFIPGVRHITGYFSGIIKIHYKKFALNGYIGAFLWVLTFIYLGDVLGGHIQGIEKYLTKYIIIILVITCIIAVIFYIIKKYKLSIKYFLYKRVKFMVEVFNSKVKIIPILISLVCLGILVFIINIFKGIDIINFTKLNELFNGVITNTFHSGFYYMMMGFKTLSSIYLIGTISVFLIIYIIKKGKHKVIDLVFLLLSCIGGLILQQTLNYNIVSISNKNPFMINKIFNNYKDETGILTIISYGILLRFFLKYNLKKFIKNILIIITFVIYLFTGISTVFFNIGSFSEILFNFIIGFIWLFINMFLFYIEEIIDKISPKKH